MSDIKQRIQQLKKKSKTIKSLYVDKNPVKKYFTGNPLLDVFTAGGIPEKRMSVFYGQKGTFKSSISIPILNSIFKQNENSIIVLLDTENSFDAIRWKILGFPVDDDRFLVLVPEYGEQIPEIINDIRSEFPNEEIILLWDSIVATPSVEEVQDDMNRMGTVARMLSTLFRKINLTKDNITLIAINQFREMMQAFVQSEQPGGNAVQHKPDFIAQLKTMNSDIIPKEVGKVVKISVDKSRLTAPFRQLKLIALYTTGVDTLLSVIHYALNSEEKVLDKARKPNNAEPGVYLSTIYTEKPISLKELQFDMLTKKETYPIWEAAFKEIKNLYKDDFIAMDIIESKYDDVINYYFQDGVIDVDKLTMMNYIRKLEILNPEEAKTFRNIIKEEVKKTTFK